MDKLYRYPIAVVLIIAVITVFLGIQLPRAQLDNNNLRFVPSDDEARQVSAYIDDTFGSSLFILVGLERKYGTVFDAVFLNQIREYVDRLKEIEIIDNVNSIVSTDYITGDAESIRAEQLVPAGFSGSDEEIAELKRRILSWDMYRRALISDDFTATQILVPLSISTEDAGNPEVVASFVRVRDIAREMFGGMAEVYVTGIPVISATINEAVNADLILLVPLVIIVVLTVLFFSFRRLSAVVLPLLTVLIAVIWSMGAMPLFNIRLSVISTVLPVILVAVGSAYGIHVITHYIEDMGLKPDTMDRTEHRELVIALVRKIGKAVFLAAFTTFVGFFSFCFTRVLPIREFGFFSSLGVFASFAVALTLIPSLLILRGPKPLHARRKVKAGEETGAGIEAPPEGELFSNVIAGIFLTIVRKKRFVLFVSIVTALVSIYGVSKVIIDNVFIEYFKSETDISKSDKFIREKFGGSKVVSVVVQAEDSGTLLHPDSLGALDRLGVFLEEKVVETGKVMGFTDLVKRINQVVNAGESPDGLKPSAYALSSDDEQDMSGIEDEAGASDGVWDPFNFGDIFDETINEENNADEITEYAESAPITPEEMIDFFERAASAGKKRGLNADELIWNLKRLTNYEGAAYYEIPLDPARYGKTRPEELQQIVSNYLMLLSGDIDDYANDPFEPTAVKTTVQLRTLGDKDTGRAIRDINRFAETNFPKDVKVIVGGSALVEQSLNRLVVQSQLISVFISIIMVFLIIAVSNRSFIAGCIGIVPLSISILINFAVMGFLGIKLNIGTSMVASVSVGIGIDYTIHYIESYKREYRASGGKGDFLRRTFLTSGKAIFINAVSVGAGFAVLLLSRFVMLADLGLLIALTMATSALVSLTVIPVLLTLIKPRFVRADEPVK
ncbi:MAG: MMPL family transporter [Treponema sp.]|jgi:predicted RND superfamily exporter protein|nr:MMPL family transporter [Treponema sp.]